VFAVTVLKQLKMGVLISRFRVSFERIGIVLVVRGSLTIINILLVAM
jgi:hypothetical protein